ncbi:MAG: hypothetical protein KVP17_004914 [Porospora cf. gigantea B]|uniref:uncharacterized protein n=1 Tax=Porospora cf. gigantea B TaxID=2853592 RepID=UPI003571F5BE|nr:MAG: hypothetical protein KVP17_004914 [Porospora cf. gigantea B]
MKLVGLQILRHTEGDDKPFFLAATHDLSSFGFTVRNAAKEMCFFIARNVVPKLPVPCRDTVKHETFQVNVLKSGDGLVFVAITDLEYPPRVAFQALAATQRDFRRKVKVEQWAAATGDLNKTDQLKYHSSMTRWREQYSDPSKFDAVTRTQKKVDDTQEIMQRNIDQVLGNMENIETLLGKSEDVSAQTQALFKSSKKMKKQCCGIIPMSAAKRLADDQTVVLNVDRLLLDVLCSSDGAVLHLNELFSTDAASLFQLQCELARRRRPVQLLVPSYRALLAADLRLFEFVVRLPKLHPESSVTLITDSLDVGAHLALLPTSPVILVDGLGSVFEEPSAADYENSVVPVLSGAPPSYELFRTFALKSQEVWQRDLMGHCMSAWRTHFHHVHEPKDCMRVARRARHAVNVHASVGRAGDRPVTLAQATMLLASYLVSHFPPSSDKRRLDALGLTMKGTKLPRARKSSPSKPFDIARLLAFYNAICELHEDLDPQQDLRLVSGLLDQGWLFLSRRKGAADEERLRPSYTRGVGGPACCCTEGPTGTASEVPRDESQRLLAAAG